LGGSAIPGDVAVAEERSPFGEDGSSRGTTGGGVAVFAAGCEEGFRTVRAAGAEGDGLAPREAVAVRVATARAALEAVLAVALEARGGRLSRSGLAGGAASSRGASGAPPPPEQALSSRQKRRRGLAPSGLLETGTSPSETWSWSRRPTTVRADGAALLTQALAALAGAAVPAVDAAPAPPLGGATTAAAPAGESPPCTASRDTSAVAGVSCAASA